MQDHVPICIFAMISRCLGVPSLLHLTVVGFGLSHGQYRTRGDSWFSSNTSTDTMFSVCECLDSVPYIKEAITQDAYKDLYHYMHFVDDWEADSDEEWEELFHDKSCS